MSKRKPGSAVWSQTLWERSSLQTRLVFRALEALEVSPEAFEVAYEAVRQEIYDRRALGVKARWEAWRQRHGKRQERGPGGA